MAQAKQNKSGSKDDDNTSKRLTPEEMAKLAEEKPLSGLLPAMIEQDRLDGLEEDHLPYAEPEEPYFQDGEEDATAQSAQAEETEGAVSPDQGLEPETSSDDREVKGQDVAETESDTKTPSATNHKIIVRGINERAHRCIEVGVMETGEFGLDAIYGGNIEAATSSTRKPMLFKTIAADPELALDPRRLAEFIGIAAIRRDFIQAGMDVSGLSASKLGALLPVKDMNLRRQLASEASERKYTVRQIKDLVKGFTPRKVTEDIGRTILKKIGGPLQMLNDDELFTVCSDRQRLLKDLSKAEREKILDQIKEGKPRLKALDELVKTLEANLEQIEEGD